MRGISVVLAQVNPIVGDIPGNARLVIDAIQRARDDMSADIVVFPELVLCGYPPEDLLLRDSMQTRVEKALQDVALASDDIVVVLGYPWRRDGDLFNVAGVFKDRQLLARYAKNFLPNYQVFDEKRYFRAGTDTCVLDICGFRVALSVCEDIWFEEPMTRSAAEGAQLMININASPFHKDKHAERREVVGQRARAGRMPVVYVNQVGGQDELVFDGGSMVVDAAGEVVFQAPFFDEGLFEFHFETAGAGLKPCRQTVAADPDAVAAIYRALVLGVRDYVEKNRFRGVVLGLSGGIDSALTAAIAVDALGPERVSAVMMPFRYTSQLSLDDAEAEAENLGINYSVLGIEPIYHAFMDVLAEQFADSGQDKTEENIQARSRGVLLMALSNKKGYLVLTTGNKSEMAVGYATLYGDMAGGLDVLKDVSKTLVFALARYRNEISLVIPESVITRPPSAELAPDQKDEDSLPPYDILDQILELYIEEDQSAQAIIARGFSEPDVTEVVRMVDLNEYKRRQAPVGIRITKKGFGRDRRYPITNGWRPGQ